MLSFYLLLIFYLIQYSLTDQCPSIKSCICSSDLTIISCINHQLTDDFFPNLDIQFPQSTTILNLSLNSFTSINSLTNLNNLQILDLSYNKLNSLPSNLFSKFPQLSSLYLQNNSLTTIPKTFNEISNINLDLSNNPLNCTCQLKWIIKWFETINLRKKINCPEKDFCLNKKNFLTITPEQSQVVYENDSFTLNCLSNTKTFWTFNHQYYSSNSTIFIPFLQLNHSGLYTCHSLNQNRSISLHVLNLQLNHFCQSIQMDTSKGYFYWPRTLTGQKIQLKCPFGSAAWYDNFAQASYICSINRQWMDLDLSQCAFRTNISREFDRLLSKNQTNILAKLVTYVSKQNLQDIQFDDIIFLIDLIDEEQNKTLYTRKNIEEISMLIYRLTDFILQIQQDFIQIKQYQLALNRLRFILEELLYRTNHSWVYVGKQLTAMTLESPLPPTICFIPNRPLLTIICGIINRHFKRHESKLATIEFPLPANTSHNQSSTFKIIFYRQATLFTTNMKINNNPVIYLKPVTSIKISPVKLTFFGESNQASIGIWNTDKTAWQMKSSTCKIDQQNIDLISTDCILTENTSLSITYLNNFDGNKSLFLNTNYLELAIYVSSIIASICFFICIFFYICCHKVYLMPRSFFHCLINYWLSLAILLPLFAFGIRQSQYLFFCQFIAITLHYLCLTTILWLTLLAYCIWQKLYYIWSGKGHEDDDEMNDNPKRKSSVTIVDYDDDGLPIMKLKAKPIIQFYLLAYGISFIICGINVAISRDQYITNKICFLNNFESLLALFIPIAIFIFLLLIFVLAARINIKRLTKEAIRLRNIPDETEIEPETTNDNDNDENNLSSKPNETLPIIIPSNNLNMEQGLPHMDCRQSHLDSLCSSDMDHQHQPSNQLISILFQLFLLIFIFLSCIAIYIHPLQSYNIPFEHSIYNHLYGIFVLLLAFYTLAFYILTRSDLTMHCQYYNCCPNRKKKRLLNQSYSEPPPPPQTPQLSPSHPMIISSKENDDEKIILNQNLSGDESFTEQIPPPSPPHSHYSSSLYQSQLTQNNEIAALTNGHTFGSKHQATIASKYYARHRHILKTNTSSSEISLQQNESIPHSTLNAIQQESPTYIDKQQIQSNPHYATSPKNLIHSPKISPLIQNGNTRYNLPSVASPRTFIRPSTLSLSPRPQLSPSQAIIRPLPIIRLSSPNINKIYSNPSSTMTTPTTTTSNGRISPVAEQNSGGRNSYRVMPSPSTEERQATYVYLNKNSHLIQQESSTKEKPSIWKKPVNGHLPHVAYIDEDDEGSVSLKSSTCDTATSSNTTSPIISRKDRSRTLSSSSSSSSSTYSHDYPNGPIDTNQIILHESSV
ncbi:unnamed protein product [Adineta steineri]|uniref:G-protein coupled receptors family 2 profile 2 domain-containing protein n=2 Tax=Adineta steineri TaxID=433720 RepID=A0A815EHR7_9BILA|nr:unnamed protein product [Adineta steineri]